MSASGKITLLQKPAFPAVRNCNYNKCHRREYCSCSIYTTDRPILTKEGEGKCTRTQATGEQEENEVQRMHHRCLTVRSRTVQNRAYPVRGSTKRQLYKNQGGLSDWLTQQHSVSRWYFWFFCLFIHSIGSKDKNVTSIPCLSKRVFYLFFF